VSANLKPVALEMPVREGQDLERFVSNADEMPGDFLLQSGAVQRERYNI
jgi:hypothetical protein